MNIEDDYHVIKNKQSVSSLKLNDFERMSFNFDEHFSKDELLSLIKNNFNNEYKKYNYRLVDNYHIIDHLPNENLDTTKSYLPVEYKYNEDFFRCDNFKKEHDGMHILFSGCSNTEGVGINIKDTWTDMLYSNLSKSIKTSGYFNLAKGGAGTQNIVSNFITYVDRYGAPDLLLVLHPNILRNYRWNDDRNSWEFKQDLPLTPKDKNDHEYVDSYMDEILNWAVQWNLFLNYCESIGTKVLWSTWDRGKERELINIKFFSDTFLQVSNGN